MRFLMVLMLLAGMLTGMGMTRADSVDDYLKAEMATRHIPGLSVAVVQDGKVVKAQGYGFASVELSVPATADTVYQIGSLTKQLTATAILQLVQDGKLGMEDKITRYISQTPKAWKTITVRQLLNQTSGLPNYRDTLNPLDGVYLKTYTAQDIIRLAAAKSLLFQPGTQYRYSNTNYHFLGMIIEKVTGKSYADYLQAQFFGPLGMTKTRLNDPFALVPNRAQGYLWDGSTLQNSVFVFSPTAAFGDDGVISTAGDLVQWNAALDGNKVLSESSKALLWTPPVLPGKLSTEYACGWIAARVHSHRLLWHNGLVLSGFGGAIFRFPDDKLTVIILANLLDIPGITQGYPMYALTLGVAQHYLPELVNKQEEMGIPDPDPQTAALLKTVSAQLAAGTLDKSLFTPAFQALLTPEAVNPAHSLLALIGPMTSLVLLKRAPDGSTLYRAIYGKTTVLWVIAVDKDHKITRLIPQKE